MLKSVALFFREGSSDKVYNVALVEEGTSYTVRFEYGRRGSSLNTGTKAERAPLGVAEKAYDKVVKEKTGKGYKEVPGSDGKLSLVGTAATGGREKVEGISAQLLNEIDEKDVERLIKDPAWVAQRKYDGVRILAMRDTSGVWTFLNRKGQVASIPSEIAASLDESKGPMILDGELVAAESGPSTYWVFDLLAVPDADDEICESGYASRHMELSAMAKFFGPLVKVAPCAETETQKAAMCARLCNEHAEGVVFKNKNAAYKAGRPASGGSQLKLKFTKTADVILTKWTGKAYQMAVFDHDTRKLVEIGKVYTGTDEGERKVIDKMLTAGGDVVAEVRYLYATEGNIMFQPVFVRLRKDKASSECVLKQLVKTNKKIDEDEG